MNDRTTRRDETGDLAAAAWAIASIGALATLVALLVVGGRAAIGVGVGATLGVVNLWAISRVVRAFVAGSARLSWATVALVKLTVLFGVVYLLWSSGSVDVVTLFIGYGAVPVGIVAAQLRTSAPTPPRKLKGRAG
jgi:hypothetical protein